MYSNMSIPEYATDQTSWNDNGRSKTYESASVLSLSLFLVATAAAAAADIFVNSSLAEFLR